MLRRRLVHPPNSKSRPALSEVAARLIEVRSIGHSGLDLLTLSFSHFDPQRTFSLIERQRNRVMLKVISFGR
jgi:hypothetical protein